MSLSLIRLLTNSGETQPLVHARPGPLTRSATRAAAKSPSAVPESKSSATIDHLAFPHIIDNIFSCLDMPGYAIASKVCSYWRRRANKVLQRHVIASKHQDGVVYQPKSYDHPAWPYPRYFMCAELLVEFQEAWSPDDMNGNKHIDHLIKDCTPGMQELFKNVEIVDYMGPPAIKHEDAYELSIAFVLSKRNHVTARYDARLRLGPEFLEETAADTQVVFLKHPVSRVQPVIANTVVVNLDCGLPTLSPLMGERGPGHEQGCPPGMPLLFFEFPDPMPLVVLFEHDQPHGKLGSPASQQCAHWLKRYLYQWFRPTLDHPITLVGLSKFFSVEEDYRAFKQEFFDNLPSGHNVEFLTRKQYWRRVGSETYRLHTKF